MVSCYRGGYGGVWYRVCDRKTAPVLLPTRGKLFIYLLFTHFLQVCNEKQNNSERNFRPHGGMDRITLPSSSTDRN